MDSSTVDVAKLATCDALIAAGQAHLLASWPAPGSQDADKHRLLAQAAALHAAYPLDEYAGNARDLLRSCVADANPYAGYVPSPPRNALNFDPSSAPGLKHLLSHEAEGLAALPGLAFVLVAGGLGERLGFPGIKLALPVSTLTGDCYLAFYCKHISALQARARLLAGREDLLLPLVIMTSDDTHAPTAALLVTHRHFGLLPAQVTLLKQEKVPALVDTEARFATVADDSFCIETKPHGHGDVHLLLHRHPDSPLHRWRADGSVQHIFFFQDTNALAFHALLATLGAARRGGYAMTTVCVPRKPGDAVGAVCDLTRTVAADDEAVADTPVPLGTHVESGTLPASLTINVEYNVLSGLLGTEATLPDGTSPYPGNTNALVVAARPYFEVLDRTRGVVGEFINPKFADAARTAFTKPARLECMMQDLPRLLPAGAPVAVCQFPRWMAFSPVKNAPADGAARQRKGLEAEAAAAAEFDLYDAHRRLLRLCCPRAEIAEEEPRAREEEKEGSNGWLSGPTLGGVAVRRGAAVLLGPELGISLLQLQPRFKDADVSLGPRASLVLDGPHLRVARLRLEGHLALMVAPAVAELVTVDCVLPAAVAPPVAFVELPALPADWDQQVARRASAAVVAALAGASADAHAGEEQQELEACGAAEAESACNAVRARGYAPLAESDAAWQRATVRIDAAAVRAYIDAADAAAREAAHAGRVTDPAAVEAAVMQARSQSIAFVGLADAQGGLRGADGRLSVYALARHPSAEESAGAAAL